MTRFKLLVLVVALQASLLAQGKPAPVAGPGKAVVPEVVPVDQEPAHKLVFENEYVRVFSVEVAPHSETKYHQHDRDYVGVILGDADVESVRSDGTTAKIQLKDGEVLFSKGGFAHKAVNKSDRPFRNVTVELKGKSFNPTPCTADNDECKQLWQSPAQRQSPGGMLGARRKLFSDEPNLQAERFELTEDESAVSSPFVASNAEVKVLLIPVTPLTAYIVNAKVIHRPREMKPGEVMWAECSPEVAVLEGKSKREWVVLRFLGPDRPSCIKGLPCTPECRGPSRQQQGARDDKTKGAAKK